MSSSSKSSTFVVTRDQLFRAGALIDISQQAREAGIALPVAISAGVNQLASEGVRQEHEPLLPTPDFETIYYDIAWMMMLNVLRPSADRLRLGERYTFPLVIGAEEHDLKAVCTPEGRNGALVLTVLLPGED